MAQTQKFLILLLYLFLCVTAATYVIIFISRNNAVKRSIFGDFQKIIRFNSYNGLSTLFNQQPCSMATCFNFSRCIKKQFKIYVYPNLHDLPQTKIYSNILSSVRESHFSTNNPSEACLFIPDFDSTDRDKISENYLPHINIYKSLSKDAWNNGLNHIIINFYFGTYPNYANDDLGFDAENAILAWASSSRQNFRHQFDVSIPLFHSEHAQNNEFNEFQIHFSSHDPYLLSFKGKRYVYGVGSETRDVLHNLHNNHSMLIATTCRHNSDWEKFQDERCELDNREYNRWDYAALMSNTTFCLIPRGRRLGSFRFLESLRSICIPIILSDDWVLPFEEMIDWSEAAIYGDEKSVLFIYNYLPHISLEQIFGMRYFAQKRYGNHFASVKNIILTTIELISERIRRHLGGMDLKTHYL